jgi:hypothetical protein
MESSPLKSFQIKRRLDMYSTELDSPKPTTSQRKIKFDLDFEPCLIDENSCDSGFSDLKDDVDCDELTFKSLDSLDDTQIETTSDLFDSNLIIDSPFAMFSNKFKATNKLSKVLDQPSSKDVRQFKLKSKSFSVNQQEPTTFDEISIKKALDNPENFTHDRLIGDMSRNYTLPILKKSKHQDLASITPSTLGDLIKGVYSNEIGNFLILDARYPYEYQGGHIDGAQSAYHKEDLFEKLFSTQIQSANGKPLILVFHCEFSAHRGPKLMREVRERDRVLNKQNYPNLYYPEMYLLEGGYKSFFETHNDACSPKSYMPMLHDNHRNDLKYFRKKSKTWEMSTSCSNTSSTLLPKKKATPSKKTRLMF